MVPRNDDAPLMLWKEGGLSADSAGRPILLASLVSPERVGPSVRWIRRDTEHPRMGQSTPEQFAIPGTAVRPPRKAKAKLLEALDHGVGTAFSLEQFEDRSNCALHFLVGVGRNLIVVKNEPNRQSEGHRPFVRLVHLTAGEARAEDVHLCLGERAL